MTFPTLLEHVQARSYPTKEEWLGDLDQFGNRAEAAYKALRQSKSERQKWDADIAFEDTQQVETVMDWLFHGTLPPGDYRKVQPVMDLISAALAPKV